MKVLENIYLIPSSVNTYLIEREAYCVLIDTGMSKSAKKIIKTIKTYCPDKPLKGIMITHAHQDHIAGLETLGQLYGAEVVSHKEERDYIMNIRKLPAIEGLVGIMLRMFQFLSPSSGYTVDQIVTDREVAFELKVYHLPGHTPGTIAFEDIQTRALFCGDIINTNQKGSKILPPSKTFALDYEQALKASKQMFQLSKPSVILPGHGKPILDPSEAIKTYLEEYS